MGKDKDKDDKNDKPSGDGKHDLERDGQTGKGPKDIDPKKYGPKKYRA